MKLNIAGLGAWGPGFSDWETLRHMLRSGALPVELGVARPAPECIPPRERRRAPLSVKLAVAVAEQACAMAACAPEDAVCVFASGMGDMDITDYMCRTLASEQPLVSPTKFHTSVHNAPVGYWSISQGAMRSSNAVAGFLHTVPVSLLEAATQCVTEQVPVLWASQDIQSPQPFQVIADIPQACAFALLLQPGFAGQGQDLSLSLAPGSGAWPELALPAAHPLATLYAHNPTGRLLPLLETLAMVSPDPQRAPTFALPLNEQLSLALMHHRQRAQSEHAA